jgi:SHS2 domain-containing protein
MTLEEIFNKKGIALFDSAGNLRNVVDVLEDMYLKLNAKEFVDIMMDIEEEEKLNNIFNNARQREYRGE